MTNETEEVEEISRLLDPIRVRLAAFAADHPSEFPEVQARLEAVIRAVSESLQRGAGS